MKLAVTKYSQFEAVVIGCSAGGLKALAAVLAALPPDFQLPIVVVQHRANDEKGLLEDLLGQKCRMKVKQADEKESVIGGVIYFAPPDYHLLIEKDKTFSLSYDARVNFSRPSIDVLFESAAKVYHQKLLGIILTGANSDGAAGMVAISEYGGFNIAQGPPLAAFPAMPQAAIDTGSVHATMNLPEIFDFLLTVNKALLSNGKE